MARRGAEERSYRDRIRSIPLFADLEDRAIDLLDGLVTESRLDAGARLTRQGRVGRDFVLVLEGLVSVQRDGEEVARLGANTFLGEHSMLTGEARTADVVALTPVRLLVAGPAEFRRMLDLIPGLGPKLDEVHAERLGDPEGADEEE